MDVWTPTTEILPGLRVMSCYIDVTRALYGFLKKC